MTTETSPPADESLPASVARAIAARGAEITEEDGAAVDLAMRYALQIEQGVERGGQDATKALYLGPHLLKTLAELGCTPAGRLALKGLAEKKTAGGKLAARRAGRSA
ncbi:terminase small subunit [Rhodococcus pyridinivorans]|uniref:Terminase small subunit actinomycetes phage-type domain-containing protein n=1 Tax=Rhodococcus pyridinivorans TaxID=103816 RepID=A0A7M2XRJ8_9NOCA|nr:hypothetical protein [Rhodococcus pyridinivorans]QOV99521.1 hypothetical protein INP59_03720 [Rhodococcus pyridinivorans]